MKRTEHIMGMPITIEVVGRRNADVIQEAFKYFEHVDQVFSTYKPESDISRLNRGQLRLDDAPEEVQEVILASDAHRHQTGGFFDINQPQGGIDPSGLVKGWAIWNAAKLLDVKGIPNYFIEAGGDVQMRGHNSNGELWRVGIRHPTESGKFATVLQLTDCAVATSGSYERGQHIYDPHTGQPVNDPVSLTVIGPNIYEADVLATAAFAMGRPGIQFILDQHLEGMMITNDYRVVATPGFATYGKEKRSV